MSPPAPPRPVTILTSGVGLGIYLPALLVARHLRALGIPAEIEVLEEYYEPERRRAHLAHKKAHHESFELALLAHRMARDVQHCLDRPRVDALLARWGREHRTVFVVWAGFWLPLLERHRAAMGVPLQLDLCRIDAEVSASFKIHPDLTLGGTDVWLWNAAEGRTVHEIAVTGAPPLSFGERERRLVVHGGGWGIGTYLAKVPELAGTGFALDVVVHDPVEARDRRAGDRCFMVDPGWHPWTRDAAGEHTFPPLGEVAGDGAVTYRRDVDGHQLHEVIRRGMAIVSKPGGGTLIDSLDAATPVVLLEPYGYAERASGALWERLGYGISYAAWKATGFDEAVLATLHDNLVRKPRLRIDYPRALAERLGARRERTA